MLIPPTDNRRASLPSPPQAQYTAARQEEEEMAARATTRGTPLYQRIYVLLET